MTTGRINQVDTYSISFKFRAGGTERTPHHPPELSSLLWVGLWKLALTGRVTSRLCFAAAFAPVHGLIAAAAALWACGRVYFCLARGVAREKLVGFAVAHLLFLTEAGETVAWVVERIQVKFRVGCIES